MSCVSMRVAREGNIGIFRERGCVVNRGSGISMGHHINSYGVFWWGVVQLLNVGWLPLFFAHPNGHLSPASLHINKIIYCVIADFTNSQNVLTQNKDKPNHLQQKKNIKCYLHEQ